MAAVSSGRRKARLTVAARGELAAGQGMGNEFRLKEYLARIGFEAKIVPDLATLSALHAAHVAAISFESLDPLLGRPVSLDIGALQEKIVRGRRGGYCFEQNTLFKAVLEAAGFKTTALAGRVRWMSAPDAPLSPRTHMLLKVELADGPWLADVGFGGCLLDQPLRLATDIEQQTPAGTYRLTEQDGLFSLAASQPGGWRTMYMFDFTRQEPSDYEMANWFTSTNPNHVLVQNLILERVVGGRRYKIVNRRFVVEEGGGRAIEGRNIENADELARLLRETFDIEPPVPVEQVFSRIGPA
jgi:N-hydroxyarylamine O-acetyltransferase